MKNKSVLRINAYLLIVLFCIITIRFNCHNAQASGNWKGYAVYRNGVVGNLNDHAGLMIKSTKSETNPVIHARGTGYNVQNGTWDQFLNGNNHSCYGVYRPNSCSISSSQANSIVAKSQQLLGIGYTFGEQIRYDAGTATWVYPEDIIALRCDGVVEYVYEWYGWKIGGPTTNWDITKNDSNCLYWHQGFNITPRKQHTDLMTQVCSGDTN